MEPYYALLDPRGDFMVSRRVPKWSTGNDKGAVGPLHYTIKSAVAAKGVENIKTPGAIPELETVVLTPK